MCCLIKQSGNLSLCIDWFPPCRVGGTPRSQNSRKFLQVKRDNFRTNFAFSWIFFGYCYIICIHVKLNQFILCSHKACSCNDNKYKYIQRILINSKLKVDLEPHIPPDPYGVKLEILSFTCTNQYHSYSKLVYDNIIAIHKSENSFRRHTTLRKFLYCLNWVHKSSFACNNCILTAKH